jgi:hypothetical protein
MLVQRFGNRLRRKARKIWGFSNAKTAHIVPWGGLRKVRFGEIGCGGRI